MHLFISLKHACDGGKAVITIRQRIAAKSTSTSSQQEKRYNACRHNQKHATPFTTSAMKRRKQPAKFSARTMPKGVVPLPWWRVFLIQFLNIAGLGPIFGAIMGAMYGPSAFLWIVFGSIFAGGVHDYFSGMLSLRHNGASLPEFVGAELGNHVKRFMRVFSLVLLVLLATVFISGPADILNGLVPSEIGRASCRERV